MAGVVFCYCSPSALRFGVLWVHRWYSTYLNEKLFEQLLPFYHSNPFSSVGNKAFSSGQPSHTGYLLYFKPIPGKLRMLCVKILVDEQFLKYSDHPVRHQKPCYVQSHSD
ncbi:hypothetical protein ATANTOWER_001884 [Ataeniobius toweri]|uniref:Maturase K n=1 Tax=Ataeniobius toweri TaxID=208326 RepID=A0ABU7BX63_9TELE|nr:hypothetical protein [Ataeniobius toweri]